MKDYSSEYFCFLRPLFPSLHSSTCIIPQLNYMLLFSLSSSPSSSIKKKSCMLSGFDSWCYSPAFPLICGKGWKGTILLGLIRWERTACSSSSVLLPVQVEVDRHPWSMLCACYKWCPSFSILKTCRVFEQEKKRHEGSPMLRGESEGYETSGDHFCCWMRKVWKRDSLWAKTRQVGNKLREQSRL